MTSDESRLRVADYLAHMLEAVELAENMSRVSLRPRQRISLKSFSGKFAVTLFQNRSSTPTEG